METKISVTESSEAKRSIEVSIAHAEYKSRFDAAVRRTAKNARIKGFRPGKAPAEMVAKMHGESLKQDVVSNLVSEAFRSAVDEHALRVVGQPKVNVDPVKAGEDLRFVADVEIFPEPTIKDYFGVSAEVEIISEEIKDEDIDLVIDDIRERKAKFEEVTDRNDVRDGDIVTFNCSAIVDGKDVPSLNQEGSVVEVGKSIKFKEFDRAMVGLKKDGPQAVNIALPEDVGDAELDGKEALFSITITKIEQKVLPELNDELAKESGVAEDVDGLKKHIKESRLRSIQDANAQARQQEVVKAIIEKNPFELPEALIDEEVREILFEMGALDRNKRESYQVDVSQYRDILRERAEFRARRYVVLEQVIKAENLEVGDSDVDQWLDSRAAEAKMSKEDIEKAFGLPQNNEILKKMIAREKMGDILLEKAKLKEVIKEPEAAEQ